MPIAAVGAQQQQLDPYDMNMILFLESGPLAYIVICFFLQITGEYYLEVQC